MPTTIGDTNLKIIIDDHLTPASATYTWYVNAHNIRMKWPLEFTEGTYVAAVGGSVFGQKAFKRNIMWQLRDIVITTDGDFDTLMDAITSWEANDTLLYLSVKTSVFTTEIAAVGTKAAPTTRTARMSGVLQNFTIDRVENDNIYVSVEFVYQSA